MKSEIKLPQPAPVTFPCLMRTKTEKEMRAMAEGPPYRLNRYVVLFSGDKTGTVLSLLEQEQPADTDKLGHWSAMWNMSCFTPLQPGEKVILTV